MILLNVMKLKKSPKRCKEQKNGSRIIATTIARRAGNSEGYEKTRQEIIKQYFGSVLLDKILEDEKTMPVQGPTEGNPNDLNDKSPDIGGGAPSDIISGPSIDNEEPTEEPTEEQPEEQDTDVDIDIDNIEQPEEPRELS